MSFISLESNIAAWKDGLDRFAGQVPFATAKALTATANEVRADHRDLLPLLFDRPTPYTLNSLQVTPATKQHLNAIVGFRDSPRSRQHYLMPQVEGGSRPHKGFEKWLIGNGVMSSSEYAVPASGLRLNAYGNVSPGVITQILSQLAASPDAMQWETSRSRKRAGSTRSRYFIPKPGGALRRGIWRRSGKGKIEPLFLFVSSVGYSVKYNFFDLSQRIAERSFPRQFEAALAQAVRTAR
ncbi:hypothetical protein [Mesorhizobium sp. M7A.F.Ca.ET.027.03.2.1]|uniref:hypothetical protein n=1 Tax=Mesorhizobium sp. M7A.F.Ca.ET.027.03.2.1 TaxID=2496656 RepID=UPI000FCA902D|nr:hypothetical protein [Mesorhizobium sp. M7A.F.Ca.ET.027.03.2.1]RVD65258.1 hypothetical protein EN750_08970 [Mesorhizobium sp. M7A.F.Ca.ET.027.03.2.1]